MTLRAVTTSLPRDEVAVEIAEPGAIISNDLPVFACCLRLTLLLHIIEDTISIFLT